MKTQTAKRTYVLEAGLIALALWVAVSGCGHKANEPVLPQSAERPTEAGPLRWVLAPKEGEGRRDEKEFQQGQDISTHDAVAWALAAAGRLDEARNHMARALAEGTPDARLSLHAAVIAARAGREEEAGDWIVKVAEVTPFLLPVELDQLQTITPSH